jgi:hypothetical protein
MVLALAAGAVAPVLAQEPSSTDRMARPNDKMARPPAENGGSGYQGNYNNGNYANNNNNYNNSTGNFSGDKVRCESKEYRYRECPAEPTANDSRIRPCDADCDVVTARSPWGRRPRPCDGQRRLRVLL